MREFEITAADLIASQAEEIRSLKIGIEAMHSDHIALQEDWVNLSWKAKKESQKQISDLNIILSGKNDFIEDLQHIQQITDLEVQALNAEVMIMHKEIRNLQSSKG